MWRKLWLMWIVVILGLTTMPWENYVGHSHWNLVRWIPFSDLPSALSDIPINIVVFVPFGFFLARVLPGSFQKKAWFLTILMASALSTSVEFFQVYCHSRYPSTTDIWSNLFGAVLGVWLSTPLLISCYTLRSHKWRFFKTWVSLLLIPRSRLQSHSEPP